ncbi:MAG: M14 family zinc carboxypeptidase [Parvularculaceae bacterium]
MRAFFAALFVTLISLPAQAEPFDYFRPDGTVYDADIPTPDAFIGYGLGDKPVRHDIMVAYLRTLARRSDRITVETIGYSHEGRPILSFVVTAPENQARIDEIRAAHLARLDPSAPDSAGPVVVWLNYGVHGAESAGMDASIPTLYHLAAAQGEEIEAILRDTVIVIIAIFNPDGHSRRVNHVYAYGGDVAVANPAHEQHNLWMEARTNHYWFDLNRDWLLLTQPESRAWIDVWHKWKPNVSADFHEMGSGATYYFHPGVPKRKNPLVPDRERELLSSIAEGHAARLDEMGELYTSEEGFDNFYIGKGSTYPSINGGVGILFEAAAARGGAIDTDNGLRTYAQNIRIHFNTSLTTIAGARENSEDLLAYQRGFFADAENAARSHPVKAYVFSAGEDEARIDMFLQLLARHRVKAYALARDVIVNGKTYAAGNSFIVPMRQPQFTMIRGLFDRVTEFEENIFYDVSGWTLPLAFDLDYAPLDGMRFNRSLLGEEAARYAPPARAPGEARYGYAFDWDDYYAPRALYRFMKEDVITRVLMEPKTIQTYGETREFDRGAIFIPFAGQTVPKARIAAIAREAAEKDRVDVYAVDSGNAAPGVGDLGSFGSVRTLKKPVALMLFGDGVSRYSAGQLWHLLDHRMKTPLVLRRKDQLGGVDLSRFTHLIIPDGGDLDEKTTEKVKEWINAGGVLIATKKTAVWAQSEFLSEDGAEDDGEAEADKPVERRDYADKPLADAEHVIGGALFESDLDITHPLGFGYRDRSIATMRNSTGILKTPKDPVATVARYTDAPLLSGYASKKRLGEIAGAPMLAGVRSGAGAVILFADDPSFRATFYGTDKLFMNALFFSTLFSPSATP